MYSVLRARSLVRLAAASLVFVPTVIVGSTAASANRYGNTGLYGPCEFNTPNQADNKTHTYGFNDTDVATAGNQTWVNTNVINPTAVDMVYHSNITYQTDLVLLDSYYVTACGIEIGRAHV